MNAKGADVKTKFEQTKFELCRYQMRCPIELTHEVSDVSSAVMGHDEEAVIRGCRVKGVGFRILSLGPCTSNWSLCTSTELGHKPCYLQVTSDIPISLHPISHTLVG